MTEDGELLCALAWVAETTDEGRSREVVALDRLRGWLERKTWSGARNPIGYLPWPENVCILAGLDPEASADGDPAGWALLPGALAFYGFDAFPHDRHGWMRCGLRVTSISAICSASA